MVTRAELENELHVAMRAGDELRKRTLRMVLAAVKLAEVEKRGGLDEAGMTAVLQKEVKARREALADAEKARRADLVEAAKAELEMLESYLPEPLTEAELEELVRQAIAAIGAAGPQDVGKVMKEAMSRAAGRADGKAVSAAVRSLLGAA
jgi:hypothetical protein